jgi:hypothetical protein
MKADNKTVFPAMAADRTSRKAAATTDVRGKNIIKKPISE